MHQLYRAAVKTALVVLAALLSAPRLAYAQPDLASPTRPLAELIVVRGGGECLEQAKVVAQVTSWLEAERADARIRIAVEVDGQPPRSVSFRVLVSGRESAERQFHHPPSSCADLRSAVSLAIAIAIDSTVLESLGIANVTPPAERRTNPSPPPPLSSGPPRESSWRWGSGLEVHAQTGVLPSFSFAGYAGVDARHPVYSVRLGAQATAPKSVRIGAGTADVWLLAARLDGCARAWTGPLVLGTCWGISAGPLFAEGNNFTDPLATTLGWSAIIGRIGVAIPLGERAGQHAAELSFGVDGLIPLVRPRLRVETTDGTQLLASRSVGRAGLSGFGGIQFLF